MSPLHVQGRAQGYGWSEVIAGAVLRDERDEMRDVVRFMAVKSI